MAEEKMLELAIILTVVTAAAMVLPAWSQELSLTSNGAGTNLSGPAGESLNVSCQGLGDGKQKFSSMKWFDKDGNVISEGIPGTQAGENNSLILIFSDPKIEESGNYTCSAMYKEKSFEKTVSITFYIDGGKPDFRIGYENVVAKEGLRQEILCSADGKLPISYIWFDQLQNRITEDSNSSIYTTKAGEASLLVIREVMQSHQGMYVCKASNQHGLTSKIYELTVQSSSGNDTTNDTSSITGVTTVSITSTSVKFGFNFSGPVTYIKVLYNENRSDAQYSKEWRYGDSYEIRNLTSGGLYSFKFRSVPSENDTWSTPYQVVLLPGVPEVIFRNLEGGTVKLEWFRTIDEIMRGTIDRHELTYFTMQIQSGSTWTAGSCNITIQIPKCAGSTYTISGLSQRVYYQIQLRAHTASGYGEPYKQKIYMIQ